jgi:hypothetical protein
MTRRQATAAWALFFVALASTLFGVATDSITLGLAVASSFMAIAGMMELYQ